MNKIYSFLMMSVLLLTACSDDITTEPTNEPQNVNGYSFTLNVAQPVTRVTYHDNIGGQGSAYNPNSDGSNKVTMEWRDGDELVAIRWKAPYDEYIVLQAHIPVDDTDKHVIEFDTESASKFKTFIEEGEKFVLVHGDFVFDPDAQGGNQDPKIAFPTSQITKAGYGSYIHHGGVVNGNEITFRNQDGTLENLRKHEYMVAEGYVHYKKDSNGDIETDQKGNAIVELKNSKGGDASNVMMNIAHTLLRLTLFLPNEDFDSEDPLDDDLIAVSVRDADMHNIFHRYFRMHPNKPKDGVNYWPTSYNDNADKEENPYIRINLMDETTGEHGVSHRINNTLGAQDFNPKKPICVPATLGGKEGHYVTLYFSLPSRHMGLDGQNACNLIVTAFTRTHAYRSTKAYTLPDAAMTPGQVVPLNVNLSGTNVAKFKAITDPELGMTFAPGFVYANNDGNNWQYDIYEYQGQYAGMSHQTNTFGEYFTYGSIAPTEAAHYEGDAFRSPIYHVNDFKDVAALVSKNGVNKLYSLMTEQEAERVLARLKNEVNEGGLFLGYYYYDDGEGNTKHKAPGSQNDAILTAAAAGAKTKDELKAMSASVGIYIGRSSQPKFEEQDDYVFLPNSKQMNNAQANGSTQLKVPTANGWSYILPSDYTDLDATGNNSKLTNAFSTIFKFSTWTRTASDAQNAYRLQIWTNPDGKSLNSGSTNANTYTANFARPIRPVIY